MTPIQPTPAGAKAGPTSPASPACPARPARLIQAPGDQRRQAQCPGGGLASRHRGRWVSLVNQVNLAALASLVAVALLAPARAADCPPVAGALSPEQLQTGLREARDRGLLWRFEKDGRVGWLYGTLHLGQLPWVFPGPTVTRALRAADTVALEIDLTDPSLGPAMAAAIDTLRQREAQQDWPATVRERLQALARAGCLDSAGLATQPLLIQAMALTVQAARHDGLDPAYGQEAMLGGFARAAGKALVSMETPQSQFEALMPSQADEARRQLDEALDQLESGSARRVMGRLAGLWARGDLAALQDPAQWCECTLSADYQTQQRRVNDERNPPLADRIADLHSQGRRVFAAVGALHMTGPQALPGLMAARGFQVRRVALDTP